jgi:hypothetical protein
VWDGLEEHTLDNIAWNTQHLAHMLETNRSLEDKRHVVEDRSRFEHTYVGTELDRMEFTSSVPPSMSRIPSQRHHHIHDARERVRQEGPIEKTRGEEAVYYDRVGTLHLDRASTERGHIHVRHSCGYCTH